MGVKHQMVSESKSLCGRLVTQGDGPDCKSCTRVRASKDAWSGKPAGDVKSRAHANLEILAPKVTKDSMTATPIDSLLHSGAAEPIELDASDIAEGIAQDWAEAGSPRDEHGRPDITAVDPAQVAWEAREAVMAQIRDHKRIFAAEAANFGDPSAFDALVEEGRLTLIVEGGFSRYIRTMHTADGVRITQGLPVWDYNVEVGTVDLTYWSTDGWFDVLSPTGQRQSLANAERVCTRHPFNRSLAADVLATQVKQNVSEVQAGESAAQATDARQGRIDTKAREAFEAAKIEQCDEEAWHGTDTCLAHPDTKVTKPAKGRDAIKTPVRTCLGRRKRKATKRARKLAQGVKGGK